MKEIGGYFELELSTLEDYRLHTGCNCVNSGRHALELILLSLKDKIKRVWLPFYTCDVVLQPIERLGLEYKFYNIDINLEIEKLPYLDDGDFIMVNNYFGIKDSYIKKLIGHYKDKIIVDNAQALFAQEEGVKCFYSPRKFCGVPDGGIACGIDSDINLPEDFSYKRFSHLLKRIDISPSAGYLDFKLNSAEFANVDVRSMSKLTWRLLSNINFDTIKNIRRVNYEFLSSHLSDTNLIKLPSMNSFECAMVYPYLCENKKMRKYLIDNKIFVATYWPNIKIEGCDHKVEETLRDCLLPLPIDQRYDQKDMQHIVELIKNY